MRKITVAAAAAALIGSVSMAAAADLGGRASLKDEVYTPAGISWGGLYVGGSVGYGWGDVKNTRNYASYSEDKTTTDPETEEVTTETIVYPAWSEKASNDLDGLIYGGHIGYNLQRGHLVFGLEAGINGTNMDGKTFEGEAKHELDWYATGVGRLGYASGSWLLYGFGGVAWADVKTTEWGDKDDATHVGWTAGAGIEYALNNRLSLRAEYSHVDLGEETVFKGACVEDKIDVQFDAVKAGISYKLTGDRDSLK